MNRSTDDWSVMVLSTVFTLLTPARPCCRDQET